MSPSAAPPAAPLRVAIAGCGNISRGYARSLRTRPDLVELVGAFDVVSEAAQAFVAEYGGRAYRSLEEMLEDPRVEVVINLTSHTEHARVTAPALEASKHVHSEKPLASSREEGRRLLELARRSGVRLSCSPFTFLGEGQRTAWKALREGAVGRVLAAYAEANWGRIESWHPNPAGFYGPGAGPLLDVGVYPLTVLTAILGPVARVHGHARMLLPERTIATGPRAGQTFRVTTPDHVVAVLEFAGGAWGRLTASFVAFSVQRGAEFHGETGSLYLSDVHNFDGRVEIRRPGLREPEVVPWVAEPYRQGVEWGRAIFELHRVLREGAPQRVTGEHAYHVLDVCLSILESAETGRPVEVTSRFTPPEPVD